MILPGTEKEKIVHTISTDDTYTEFSPGGDDDSDGDDWDDEDDENFDDMADDENNLHDIIVEEDLEDPNDDDHLPDDDF
ncbi:hypothetical protein [Mucilaginibacter sp. OK098]|uniref:hypothetical protein n=1 Tax=Mucilaginibacter sp. OK098 TaxID=1855297 RepID=UPI00091ED632|nr:hypothetical protein [Mucilaginibacter sp. OK098]SHM45625.1 hypothetical protein SAMN05216524_102167 [Mucilaginibacter sp. OK098]